MAEFSPTDVQKALKGAAYPSDRDELVELARKNHADSKLVDKIAHSDSRRFDGPNDVQKAVFNE